MLYSDALREVLFQATHFQGRLTRERLKEITYRVINENGLNPEERICKGRNGKLAQALQLAASHKIVR